MADIQSNGWLVFFRRNGPYLISLLLAALIAVDLVRILTMLAGGTSHPIPQLPAQKQPKAVFSSIDAAQIVAAHLFGIVNSDQDTSETTMHRSTAALAMVGTIATQNPQRGIAIIGDHGEFKVYSVGEHIGDASLHSVYLDHVVLDRHGALETLALPRAIPGTEYSAPNGHQTQLAATGRDSARTQQASPIIDTVADSDTESDSEGRMLGIRVVPGKDTATFNHSGLKGGDVIVAVNGSKLDTTDRSQDIWKQVSTGTTVTVIRWGKTQDVTLNFAP